MSIKKESVSAPVRDRIDGDIVERVYNAAPAKKSNINRCPVCDSKEWYVVQGPGPLLPYLPLTPDGMAIQAGAMHELVSLACQQCGFLKSHLKPLFDAYAKTLDESAGSD